MTLRRLHVSILALLVSTSPAVAGDKAYLDLQQDGVITFIDDMVNTHAFDRDELSAVLAQAQIKAAIVKRISTPAERTLSWGEYRKIFITTERINAGAKFWRENDVMLKRIAGETGVPVEILVGIIGVETYFGRITGRDRVIDALATLAFGYPPRARFFRKELAQFLILAREEKLDPTLPTGSYAGAMGRPQFMPSSFRAYAVDSSGDGRRDIWNNWTDVAGSIANYFLAHHWRVNEELVARASLSSAWTGPAPTPKNTLTMSRTVESLSNKGVVFATDLQTDRQAELLSYEGDNGMEYWVGFHNFFVITKYNRSVMYALAVHQLGQRISAKVSSDEA